MSDSQQIDLRTLIGHATAVQAEGKLQDVYQPETKKCVRYAAAGHPLPRHLRRVPGFVERLGVGDNSRGPALGLFEEPVYLSGQRELNGGDVVLFFTDGLFEAVNEANMEFGEARLAAALAELRNQPLQRLLDEMVSEVERFTGTRRFGDDVCVLAMELMP
jgi:sigma-B regulation protein RsbU (phosphoserine phosphatase)